MCLFEGPGGWGPLLKMRVLFDEVERVQLLEKGNGPSSINPFFSMKKTVPKDRTWLEFHDPK